jgi:hypothetical protein
MITGEHDYLVNLAKFNVCAEHKTPLEVAWYNKQWCLRCGGDGGHYPDAVTRQLSLTQGLKAGEELPEPIKSNVIKGAQRRRRMQGKGQQFKEYGLMPLTDLGTNAMLVPEEAELLIKYAEKCKLDAWLGHVCLMYGKPYITIDGYLYHARKSGKEYSLESRPMTTVEKDQYMLGATDHGWIAVLRFPRTGETFTGTGIVTYAEMTEPGKRDPNSLAHPVVAAHPWQLGQKRAEWQALRRGFPIGGE